MEVYITEWEELSTFTYKFTDHNHISPKGVDCFSSIHLSDLLSTDSLNHTSNFSCHHTSFILPFSVLPPSLFPDLLIQRPSGTSYVRSVGFNQTPLACRHIPSSKKTKGRVAVGRVNPLPFNSHKSFNHHTDRKCFFPFHLP